MEVEEVVQDVLKKLDDSSEPLTGAQYREALGELIDQLRDRLEAAKHDE